MSGFRWLSSKLTYRYYLSQTTSWANEQSTINADHLLRTVHLFVDHAARAKTAGVMTRIPSCSTISHLLLTGRRTTLAIKTNSKIRTNITKKQNYETRHNLDSIQFVANFKFFHLSYPWGLRMSLHRDTVSIIIFFGLVRRTFLLAQVISDSENHLV